MMKNLRGNAAKVGKDEVRVRKVIYEGRINPSRWIEIICEKDCLNREG